MVYVSQQRHQLPKSGFLSPPSPSLFPPTLPTLNASVLTNFALHCLRCLTALADDFSLSLLPSILSLPPTLPIPPATHTRLYFYPLRLAFVCLLSLLFMSASSLPTYDHHLLNVSPAISSNARSACMHSHCSHSPCLRRYVHTSDVCAASSWSVMSSRC